MHSDAVPQRVKRVFKLKSERSLTKLWCVSFALQNSEDEKGENLSVSSQKEDWGGGVNPTNAYIFTLVFPGPSLSYHINSTFHESNGVN